MHPRAEQWLCLGVWRLALSQEKAQGEVLEAVGDAGLVGGPAGEGGPGAALPAPSPAPGGSPAWPWLQAAAGSHGSAESFGRLLLLILPPLPALGSTLK